MLRFFSLLSLALWLGAILFFAAGVSPRMFGVLTPVPGGRVLAGQIVGGSLLTLHYLGIVCGLAFLVFSFAADRKLWLKRHLLVLMMLALTMSLQFWIAPRIERLRSEVSQNSIYELRATDPRRASFGRLHWASTALEAITFLLGLIAFAGAARPTKSQ